MDDSTLQIIRINIERIRDAVVDCSITPSQVANVLSQLLDKLIVQDGNIDSLRLGVQALQRADATMNTRVGAVEENMEDLKGSITLQGKRINSLTDSVNSLGGDVEELLAAVTHVSEQADAAAVYRCVVGFDGVVADSSALPGDDVRYCYFCEDTGLFAVNGYSLSDYMTREGMSAVYSVRRDVLFLSRVGELYRMTDGGLRSFGDVGGVEVLTDSEIDSFFETN